MSNSIAIVGPGRLGQALARLWRDAGRELLGFVGRDAARAEAAVAFAGGGRVLVPADLARADTVVLTVADRALAGVVHELAGHAAPGSLWLHTSGVHGPGVLDTAAEHGARIAALHPLAPVPDPAAGVTTLPGRPALVEAAPELVPELVALACAAGLEPIVATTAVDRARYHAACALAANGTTALGGVASLLIAGAAGLPPEVADRIAGQLCAAAGQLVAERGAADALSGPLLRGDVAVLVAHLDALGRAGATDAVALYRELTRCALPLAAARGVDGSTLERVRRLLDGERID